MEQLVKFSIQFQLIQINLYILYVREDVTEKERVSTSLSKNKCSFKIQNLFQNKCSFHFSIQLYLYLSPPPPLLISCALSIFLLLLNPYAQLIKLHLFQNRESEYIEAWTTAKLYICIHACIMSFPRTGTETRRGPQCKRCSSLPRVDSRMLRYLSPLPSLL